MKRAIAVFCLGVWTLLAADVAGKWVGTATTTDAGTEHLNVVLKVDGGSITGDLGPNADRRFEIVSGKVDGTKVTFRAVGPGGGTFDFDLSLTADGLTGTCRMTRGEDTQNAKVEFKRAN